MSRIPSPASSPSPAARPRWGGPSISVAAKTSRSATWSRRSAAGWADRSPSRQIKERYRPAASEVERLLAGTALAQSLWGWKPSFSLEEGLDETITWVRDHLDRFRVESYTT